MKGLSENLARSPVLFGPHLPHARGTWRTIYRWFKDWPALTVLSLWDDDFPLSLVTDGVLAEQPPDRIVDDVLRMVGAIPEAKAVIGHIIGPVTAGLSMHSPGEFEVAELVAARACWFGTELRKLYPEAAVVVVLDEDLLHRLTGAGVPGRAFIENALGTVMHRLRAHEVLVGLRCGPVPWGSWRWLIEELGEALDLLFINVVEHGETLLRRSNANALKFFLEAGRWIVWGFIPPEEAHLEDSFTLGRRLYDLWRDLDASRGVPYANLSGQALFSTAGDLRKVDVAVSRSVIETLSEVSAAARSACL